MSDPLSPSPRLLCKLGSIAVHVEELLSPFGHTFDKVALESLQKDPEVKAWLKAMSSQGMIPEPRNKA